MKRNNVTYNKPQVATRPDISENIGTLWEYKQGQHNYGAVIFAQVGTRKYSIVSLESGNRMNREPFSTWDEFEQYLRYMTPINRVVIERSDDV